MKRPWQTTAAHRRQCAAESVEAMAATLSGCLPGLDDGEREWLSAIGKWARCELSVRHLRCVSVCLGNPLAAFDLLTMIRVVSESPGELAPQMGKVWTAATERGASRAALHKTYMDRLRELTEGDRR